MFNKLKEYFYIKTFQLYPNHLQQWLINKNGVLFLFLNKKAKECNNYGDLRSAIDLDNKSFKYLIKFSLYCNLLNINKMKRLNKLK